MNGKINLLLILLLSAAMRASAADVMQVSTGSILSAQVAAVNSISIKVKSIAANSVVPQLAWDTQTSDAGWVKANSYIELTVNSNSAAWNVDIYTNNTGADSSLLQKNGLLCSATSTLLAPLGWVISDSPAAIPNTGAPGSSSVTNTINYNGGTYSAMWTYVKDKGDLDDPSTPANNESWAASQAAGYTSVIYGNSVGQNLAYLKPAVSPEIIYIEGGFNYAIGGTAYQTQINFDLVFQ